MKRWKGIIRVILTLVLFMHVMVRTAMSVLPATDPIKILTRDSLSILDSLVNHTKVINNMLAIKYARMALSHASRVHSDSARAVSYQLLGIAYLQNHKDSSYFYFDKAYHIADSNNFVKLKIPVIYNLAMLYYTANNYREAITLLDSSIRLAKSTNDNSNISLAYTALGNINFNIHDFKSAREMYEAALEVARKDSMYTLMGVALGNLAKNGIEKDTIKALTLQREAINYLKKANGTEEEMAYILISMGYRYKNPDSALFYYKSALKLAVNANLPKIQFGAYNNMAYSYLDKGDIHMAESCLRDYAIPVALKEKDHDWLSSLYDTYADVCVARHDYKKAFEMQRKALKEKVRDYSQKASELVILQAALLDLKDKELTIQNEQKELLLQRNRLQKTELWLAVTLLLVIASVFVTLVLQQRNHVKLHREQVGSARKIIEKEENEKGRTARELHDLTGHLVLGISATIENIDFPDPEVKEQIKNRIGELGRSIRQISHRMNRAMIEHFTFSELITGLCEDIQKISGMSIQIEIPDEFPDLPNELVLHFYRITQELLTNAGKYARDSQIKIKIITGNDKLTLFYSDTGPGFSPEEKSKTSMGIMNIFERTKLINGQAVIKSSPGKGTTWKIIFPVTQMNVVIN